MTVSSLWKALDRTQCGKPVGINDLARRTGAENSTHGNVDGTDIPSDEERGTSKPLCLAVDLSIWICESLTSHAMKENHANPSLNLVFARTIKLLLMGIKLVFVIEGKRRIRGNPGDEDKFRKRRSGTAFWKACNDCQRLLQLLGVPVCRAKAEGEALCALLNARGIVDGVISKDGDCLLFGAKTVYTNFSIENLANNCVMRYDLDDLRAVVEYNDTDENGAVDVAGSVRLSRQDLVAFALLTGSDLAGPGLDKVGHKKAIRFITKCKRDNPMSPDTAAMDEMRSWAKAATAGIVGTKKPADKCCSRCTHGGSKKDHLKHGCEQCGTEPGEPCFELSSDDRFRKSLRSKALEVRPPFEPSQVFDAYMKPNENQIPFLLSSTSSKSLVMAPPKLRDLLGLPIIVKGRSLESSREYLKNAVTRLLAKNELFRRSAGSPSTGDNRHVLSREQPVARRIVRKLFQHKVACYEVEWTVNATLTDENGEGINGYEFSTVEPRDLVEKSYPKLIDAYAQVEKEQKKQGDGEQLRRKAFLEALLGGASKKEDSRSPSRKVRKIMKEREEFFRKQQFVAPPEHLGGRKTRSKRHNSSNGFSGSDDVFHLLRGRHGPGRFPQRIDASPRRPIEKKKESPHRLLQRKREKKRWAHKGGKTKAKVDRPRPAAYAHSPIRPPPITPGDAVFCRMGSLQVEITPIISSNQGEGNPPRNIYVRDTVEMDDYTESMDY